MCLPTQPANGGPNVSPSLASLFGGRPQLKGAGLLGGAGAGGGISGGLLSSRSLFEKAAARKRRVFFSFHFQNDINRVNIVRQSWRFRPEDDTQPADWFDNSLWEATKKKGSAALKSLINGGMNNTSVTCVLAGKDTWTRPWVRYEIAYALSRGNGLFGAFIHNVKCMKAGTCLRGNNPFDHIGLKWSADDKAYIWEKFGGAWRKYAQLPGPVTWPKWLPNVTDRKYVMPLSNAAAMYDYAEDDGYKNLAAWAHGSAAQAGR